MYTGDYLGRREIYSPDKVAIIDAGKPGEPQYTYRQMNERANRLGNFLHNEVGHQARATGWVSLPATAWSTSTCSLR
jgi:acyl-coenzyme A synthetase/AMP-(fatty) acid ligase